MKKQAAAWAVAILGIAAELFIATLDFWIDVPEHVIALAHSREE